MISKLSRIIENVPKVFAAGKASMVDESKLIPTNVVGTRISVGDVSKLPHDVSCKVESLNLFAPTLKGGTMSGITAIKNDDNSYTFSGTSTSEKRILCRLGTFYPDQETIYYLSGGTNDLQLYFVTVVGGEYSKQTISKGDAYSVIYRDCERVDVLIPIPSGQTISGTVKPMISLYDHSTYTPYVSPEGVKVIKYGADESEGYQELTSNADGIVEGMKSNSPYMNIKTDTEGVVLNVTYNKSWGMQYEYDRVWDDVQQNGNRTSYHTYFASKGWVSGKTYNPKYPINCVANGATSMFSNSSVTDTLVPITISGGNASVFYGSSIVTIPLLILGSGLTTMSDWFNNMTKLENITFEGEIYLSTSFAQSTKLTAKSMVNIVEHLSDTASGKKVTFSATAVNNANWSSTNYSSFEELVATKPNWTIGV